MNAPVFSAYLRIAPMASPRPRAGKDGAGNVRMYMPDSYVNWTAIAMMLLQNGQGRMPNIGYPVSVSTVLVFARPKRKPPKYPLPWVEGRVRYIGTEDLDNLYKSVWDASQKAGVIENDRLFVVASGSKWYAAEGEEAHIELAIWRVD